MHLPHGLEPIHARHENVEQQQVEIAGFELGDALSSVCRRDHAVVGPLQQEPDSGLNSRIVIYDQYFCRSISPADLLDQANFTL